MKKILCLLIVAAMLLVTLPMLAACGSKPAKGTVTRLTVDINPSVELMIDDENKVVSAIAMNDDASILLCGEVLVGKTPEEATEVLITLAAETGYLTDEEGAHKTVKISISGDDRYAKKLYDAVEKQAARAMKDLGIAAKVEKVKALELEALRAMAAKTSLYTEEELAAMNEKQLYQVLAAGRVETALLITEELREAYYAAKRHEVDFARRQATANVIDAMGGLYGMVHSAYNAALTAYSNAIKALDEFRYNTFVSAESGYQKKLAEMRAAKVDLLEERVALEKLDPNSAEYAEASQQLAVKENAYNTALAAFESVGNTANMTLEALVSALVKCEEALVALEKNFNDDIKEKLQENAEVLEKTINEKKDAFFASFEAAHKSDIQAVEATLQAHKDRLMAEVENK